MRGSRKLRISNNINIGTLLGVGFFASLMMNYVYARSIYYAYVFLSFAIMIFCYTNFVKNIYKINKNCRIIILIVLLVSILNAIIYGDIKSNLMLNTSLVLPFVISTLDIKLINIKKGLICCCLFSLLCVVAQVEFNIFGHINSNSFSFLAYMGISIAFLWFKYARRKMAPVIYLIISYYYILQTGSRSVAIVILVCFILLVIPKKFWENVWFYRSVYIVAILYTVFALYIMETGFANNKIAETLNEYVASFSEKGWEMEKRVDFLIDIQLKLRNTGILEQLFGTGTSEHHGHNLFFQGVYVYGYLGTALIYATYVIMFEMAYKVIKKECNIIIVGCVIVMIGHFLIQGADVYMLGGETCIVMPLIIMGIIMQQYRQMCQHELNDLEGR